MKHIEANRLIAEFMELAKDGNNDYLIQGEDEKLRSFFVRQLKYHKSWDWLMPVVEKIDFTHAEFSGYEMFSTWTVKIESGIVYLVIDNDFHVGDNWLKLDIVNGIGNNKSTLGNAHEFCVKFIKWYNTNS